MRTSLLLFILIMLHQSMYAQKTDSLMSGHIKEVTVTAYKEESLKETSLNITALKIDSLTQGANYNLTDLLAKVPGVTMLSTGVSIAKPVIRGLYGNRVLVLISGLKFDNQQWQEEHGLGLSDIGLSKVELIKGPMSVLYGTEAIGGIINVIEEEKPALHRHESDFSIKVNSNTMGGLMQAGYKVNKGKTWYRLRAGVENNADYSDGNHTRVLNSRFDAYYLKSSFGFKHKHWISNTNFLSSFNRFGFIFNDVYDFVLPDARSSRKLDVNPCHLVLLNMLSSENKIMMTDGSKLSINAGVQSNERMENEGGGAISLNMHLFTAQYLLKWEKKVNERHKIILSNLGSFEDNTNFGARKIVPDAQMQESNLSVYYETNFNNQFILENGIGAGEKWIKTFFTPGVNGPEKEIHLFSKFSPYYNAFTGLSFIPNTKFNAKLNIATGVRIPNLAELSSNGLHEGVFTYEIGDPLLKNEQNVALNIAINYEHKYFEFYSSPFYNYFYNYVYLAPTTEDWYGFPVFRYKQQNASQYGAEFTMNIKPFSNLVIGSSYAGMVSKTADGNYTPYLPAQKISPKIQYQINNIKKLPLSLYTAADLCLAQHHVYLLEKTTPQYWLLNAGLSTSIQKGNTIYEMSIAGTNLLDIAYYDHLSRFKNYGLLNIGRNIVMMLRVKFNAPNKAQ